MGKLFGEDTKNGWEKQEGGCRMVGDSGQSFSAESAPLVLD